MPSFIVAQLRVQEFGGSSGVGGRLVRGGGVGGPRGVHFCGLGWSPAKSELRNRPREKQRFADLIRYFAIAWFGRGVCATVGGGDVSPGRVFRAASRPRRPWANSPRGLSKRPARVPPAGDTRTWKAAFRLAALCRKCNNVSKLSMAAQRGWREPSFCRL